MKNEIKIKIKKKAPIQSHFISSQLLHAIHIWHANKIIAWRIKRREKKKLKKKYEFYTRNAHRSFVQAKRNKTRNGNRNKIYTNQSICLSFVIRLSCPFLSLSLSFLHFLWGIVLFSIFGELRHILKIRLYQLASQLIWW